jgi:CHASE1-domain containing sensor protein
MDCSTRTSSVRVYHFAIDEHYPGVQAIGFSLRIPPDQKTRIEQVLKTIIDDFEISPTTPRDEYHAIIYIEPQNERNLAASGFDMFSEPVRRLAMEKARDTGLPAMTSKVTLKQRIDEEVQAGFLIYVPIYKQITIPKSLEDRQQLIHGYAYSPFRAGDFFSTVQEQELDGNARFEVYDGENTAEENRIFQSREVTNRDNRPFWLGPYSEVRRMEIAGHVGRC